MSLLNLTYLSLDLTYCEILILYHQVGGHQNWDKNTAPIFSVKRNITNKYVFTKSQNKKSTNALY
jgi:hypothetical protein